MVSRYELVYQVVKSIPEGRVATYGQVAKLIGLPRWARHVGYALAALPADHQVPWHRVVNAKGEISRRSDPGCDEFQRILLENEGIVFDASGRISLRRYQWQPAE